MDVTKKTDKILDQVNSDAYKKVKSTRQFTKDYDSGKQKIIKRTVFENGVVKNKLVGVKKDGKVIFDRGIK
ncbi:MAG: hypothetical protein SVV88_10970 [Pseudomonadota bacterium]|nr:hypothetical protein [Pseudomonadota bacterium]